MSSLLGAVALFWFALWVGQILRNFRGREILRQYSRKLPKEVEPFVRQWGSESNAFLCLYPGFYYFTSKDPKIEGVIAFVNTFHAWVAASHPLAPPENHEALLKEFSEVAAKRGKVAVMLPVGDQTAEIARKLGYGAVMIGAEPVFSLDTYIAEVETVLTAKTLHQRGARVREFRPDQVGADVREQLEQIIDEWLGSRKMAPLRFLNRVAPWELMESKKYFLVEIEGRVLAFLAAIPIWNRQGWYLIDLLRRNDSPPGGTEILVLEAIRLLKLQGAKEVTLGVAPLSDLKLAPQGEHERIYKVLKQAYQRGSLLYNFKPLHQFKLKFNPSKRDRCFLIFKPAKVNSAMLFGLAEAFVPRGVLFAMATGAIRKIRRINIVDWMGRFLSPEIVVRSVPVTWKRWAIRCKGTLLLTLLFVFIFFLTREEGAAIHPDWVKNWGFSWNRFTEFSVLPLLSSPFLHIGWFHLCLNLMTLILFCGFLEFLAGTGFMTLCFALGALLSNPLTLGVLRLFTQQYISEYDLGASLGIWASAGALSVFLKKPLKLLVLLTVAALVAVWVQGSWLQMNHWVAMGVGILTAKFLLRS